MQFIKILIFALSVINVTKIGCFSTTSNAAIAHNWTRTEKMDNIGIFQLQWYLEENKIVFKAIVNSRGFIALGFTYPNANYKNKFDIALAWIDDSSGNTIVLVNLFHTKSFINKRRTYASMIFFVEVFISCAVIFEMKQI
jgi:hypothetical protein